MTDLTTRIDALDIAATPGIHVAPQATLATPTSVATTATTALTCITAAFGYGDAPTDTVDAAAPEGASVDELLNARSDALIR